MDSDLKRFEEELERLSPGSLPEGLISRMEAAMEGWEQVPDQFGEEVAQEIDKVVPFPPREEEEEEEEGGSQSDRDASHNSGRSLWAAVASVAVLGALAGLFVTSDPEEKPTVADQPPAVSSENVQPVEFAARSAKRKILGASDENVVIANGAQAFRMMRIEYIDHIMFRNAAGEEVHLEVPAVKYRLVPVVPD